MDKREILNALRDMGYLEYGAVISGSDFRDICDIKTIETGTRDDFTAMALEELNFAGYIRNALLNEGKYFKSERDSYRVLLPSENYSQVVSYMQSADQKLKRGLKLNKNTPVAFQANPQDQARIVMKKESIKRYL